MLSRPKGSESNPCPLFTFFAHCWLAAVSQCWKSSHTLRSSTCPKRQPFGTCSASDRNSPTNTAISNRLIESKALIAGGRPDEVIVSPAEADYRHDDEADGIGRSSPPPRRKSDIRRRGRLLETSAPTDGPRQARSIETTAE